jgi:hypothetical protein
VRYFIGGSLPRGCEIKSPFEEGLGDVIPLATIYLRLVVIGTS